MIKMECQKWDRVLLDWRGEPSGTHGKYTVKDKRDRKMWKILCFLLQREDSKKRNVLDPSQ